MKTETKDLSLLFGKVIRCIRKEKKLSQKELSRKVDGKIDASYIGRIERGKQNPSLHTIQKITGALRVDWSYFLEYMSVMEYGVYESKDEIKKSIFEHLDHLSKKEICLYRDLMDICRKYFHQVKMEGTETKDSLQGSLTMPSITQKAASRTGYDRYKSSDKDRSS